MKNDIVIQVENLSKQYRIGEKGASYGSLRESLANTASAQIRRFHNSKLATRSSKTIWALKNVTFNVNRGDVVGIIGRNGAGKSTLLKILSRITKPTEGRAVVRGRVGSLLEVGTGFHPELTGRENIFFNGAILGMKRAEIDRKFDEIVDFADIERFLDTPVKRYSSGMYMRLAFAIAAYLDPEILLVDEVLAVGDAEFQKKCLGKMNSVAYSGNTVLFVSHNMAAVQQLCASGIVLDKGVLEFNGNSSNAINYYLQNADLDQSMPLLDRTDRKGSQWLKFHKVDITSEEGNKLKQVLTGQSILLKFYYISIEEIKDAKVNIAFNIRSDRGNILTNLNSIETGSMNLDIFKEGYFQCSWPQVNLRSGTYDCALFCSINGEIVDWLQSAFLIHVEDGDYFGTGKIIDRGQGDFLVQHMWSSHQF